MNQAVFEKIWVNGHDVVAGDIAEPVRDLLDTDLDERLAHEASALTRPDASRNAWLCSLRSRERPNGLMAWETTNHDPSDGRGSNETVLVGPRGLEPRTSSLSGKRSNRAELWAPGHRMCRCQLSGDSERQDNACGRFALSRKRIRVEGPWSMTRHRRRLVHIRAIRTAVWPGWDC